MDFSGDRSHSAPFIITEESMHFWACPWEELEASNPPQIINTAEPISALADSDQPPERSVWHQGLMWSLLITYLVTISIIGYGVYEAINHWGPKLLQEHQSHLGL